MDYTLTKSISGRTFAKNGKDWQWWDPSVPKKLREYNENGFKIVIFTNQGGIFAGHFKETWLKEKLSLMYEDLGVPFVVFAALGKDKYRKPGRGSWDMLVKEKNDGVEIDMKESLFCGDAAGRKKTKTRKRDFSDGDKGFAIRTGLKFYVPEEFFLDEKMKKSDLAIDMTQYFKNSSEEEKEEPVASEE